jgi:hypothetical protein
MRDDYGGFRCDNSTMKVGEIGGLTISASSATERTSIEVVDVPTANRWWSSPYEGVPHPGSDQLDVDLDQNGKARLPYLGVILQIRKGR